MDQTETQYRRPQSVLIVVYTQALDCLLLERLEPAGFWQSVTGTMNWGETAALTAERELFEETGLGPGGLRDAGIERSFPILPAWSDRYAADVTSNTEHLWYLMLPAPVEIQLNNEEHRQYGWWPVAEAIDRVSSWTNREALTRLADGDS